MTRSRRPSAQTTAVVLALAEEPTAWRYGYQLCQQLDIKPGSLYPILMRLTDRGLLEATWDTDVPAGRPPRHLYRLTGSGRALATELAADTAAAAARAPRRPEPEAEVAGRMSWTPAQATVATGRRGGVGGVLRRRSRDRRPADPTPVTAVAQLVVPPLLWVALLQIGSVVVAARRCPVGPRVPYVRDWTRRGGCSPPRWRRCPNAGASGVAR